MEEAVGFYYLVAGKIAQAQKNNVNWKVAFKEDICYLIDLFKNRKANDGQILSDYSSEVKNSAEYKKVETYFEEIKQSAQCGVQNA